jgi:TRAP-type C4-dicarboxylate transport system substrate-binding protein
MGDKWRQATSGAVRLTVFPDGVQGSEADMVGLMQTGNLDAGLLTTAGLSEIEPAVNALQNMPMTFRSLDEIDHVRAQLAPLLEQRLAAKGYLVLFWTDSGWVRFFSKHPILHPDDLRKMRVFTWAGNAYEYDLWKASGFQAVALETSAIPQALMSDTIDAIPMPPFFALAGQLNEQTKYMLDLNWAPLVGAGVVRKKSWDRVPAAAHKAMFQIAAETGKQITAEGRAENRSAVSAMVKRGLVVQTVSPAVESEWRSVVGTVQDKIRGKLVPADMYDEVHRLLKAYRESPGAKGK